MRDSLNMNRDLFLSDLALPDIIVAPRTDPIYNAHGYLTKVPVDAITPYISAFTEPGEVVVDMFAGSGMTAIAARIAGRSATVSDISALGRHIGQGYLTEVPSSDFRLFATKVIQGARTQLGELYLTQRSTDGASVEFVRTIWSFVYQCAACSADIIYYEAMASNEWAVPTRCPHCQSPFQKRGAVHIRDIPVRVVVDGEDKKQLEQPVVEVDFRRISVAEERTDLSRVPNVRITADREMYKRSALGKWGLDDTRQFFSARNALALYYVWTEIQSVDDTDIRQKLLFAFTAILPRASRRYQWSHQRPLNAATQNYYIAPVYFEWNVFELFDRKVDAARRSDAEIAARSNKASTPTTQNYVIASAASLTHLRDASVDYVFTDPPFGSNLFYADMNLFQEAWLDRRTDDAEEAVIHTNGKRGEDAALRYEDLLGRALAEAHRILKPGRHLSLVFGNSSGRVWSMVQRMLRVSGFDSRPVHIGILDKGQRSVKGLNSGSENVSTLDLVLTVRKSDTEVPFFTEYTSNRISIAEIIDETLGSIDVRSLPTASHVYLTILKHAFALGLDVESLNLSDVLAALQTKGLEANAKSGMLEVA
ncbi:MAG: DNA methyltransferase [Steroidobacteraceae bacterium]